MGNSESKEGQLFIGVILQLLNKRGIKVTKTNVRCFFTFVQEQCPWFPEEGTVNLDTWEKVGKQLKTYYTQHGPEKVPTDTFSLWNMIRDTLDPAHESEKVHVKEGSEEEESKPDYRQLNMLSAMNTDSHAENRDEKKDQLSPQDEEDSKEVAVRYHSDEDSSFLAKDTPKSLREISPSRPSVRFKHQTVKGSLEQEKKNMGRLRSPMPPPPHRDEGPPLAVPWRRVLSNPEDEFDPHLEACFSNRGETPYWEPLPMKMIKELKQACALYGATAPYTITVLEALAARWMTPHDWKTVAKACLSRGQYVLWRAEYEDLAQKQADANQKYGPRYIVKSMLTGTHEFGTLRGQMGLDGRTLDQVTACSLGAWRHLPQGKESTSFLNIRQKPEELYEDFISRLTEAVYRVISNSEAAEILIKHLAFENANSTCQAVLHPIKESGQIEDYIRQCADIGPAVIQAIAIAAAIKGNSYQQEVQSFFASRNNLSKSRSSNPGQNTSLSKACYSCGREGHFVRTCPQKAAGSYMPNPASLAAAPNLPKVLCPRCQKGYHWAKDCRSRFHKNGTLLVPDQQLENRLRGQPQALTMIGATMLNPFIPFIPSQNSSEQPQAPQDWTSVLPPQQY